MRVASPFLIPRLLLCLLLHLLSFFHFFFLITLQQPHLLDTSNSKQITAKKRLWKCHRALACGTEFPDCPRRTSPPSSYGQSRKGGGGVRQLLTGANQQQMRSSDSCLCFDVYGFGHLHKVQTHQREVREPSCQANSSERKCLSERLQISGGIPRDCLCFCSYEHTGQRTLRPPEHPEKRACHFDPGCGVLIDRFSYILRSQENRLVILKNKNLAYYYTQCRSCNSYTRNIFAVIMNNFIYVIQPYLGKQSFFFYKNKNNRKTCFLMTCS